MPFVQGRALKAALGDADDFERLGVQSDHASEDVVFAAEPTLPRGVADDTDPVRPFSAVVFRTKQTTDRRLDAECRKIAAADQLGGHILGRSIGREVHANRPPCGRSGKHVLSDRREITE